MNIKIGNSFIGDGHPAFIVAEMSGNHCGDINRALEIIRQAKKSGANAIKLQTYKPETITLKSNKPYFLLDDDKWGESKTLWDLYKEAHTPWEWHKELFEEARNVGIEIFSSPFDESAIELLEKLKCPAYKVASPEINHIPLLEHLAETKKPIILSSGVAKLTDIELAIDTLRTRGVKDIILLKCNTSYPAPIEESNLLTIIDIKKRFNVLSGLSDHTIGNVCAISSVALGASFIEKHFNLSDNLSTVDSFFSSNSVEFQKLVDDVRLAEKAIGKVDYALSKSASLQTNNMRSIFASKDIKVGEKLSHLNIKIIRPGQGLHPKHLKNIIGKTVKSDISEGEPLIWSVIS